MWVSSDKSKIYQNKNIENYDNDGKMTGWRLDFLILTAIIIIFGFIGGTPYLPIDFITTYSIKTVSDFGRPAMTAYPAFIFYVHGAVYAALYLIFLKIGFISSVEKIKELKLRDAMLEEPFYIPFHLPGHIITLIFSLAAVIACYLILRWLVRSRAIGLAAGGLLALSSLWISESHLVTVDVPLAAMGIVTIALVFGMKLSRERPEAMKLLVIGAAFGLTTATKYSGAFIFTSLFAYLVFYYTTWRQRTFSIFLVGAVGVMTFLVVNPYFLLDPDYVFSSGLLTQATKAMATGHFGANSPNKLEFYFRTLWSSQSALGSILSVIGLISLIYSRNIEWKYKLILTAYPITHFIVIASAVTSFPRYADPLMPFLAVYSAFGIWSVYRYVSGMERIPPLFRRFAGPLLAGVFGMFVVVPSAIGGIAHNVYLMSRPTAYDLAEGVRGSGDDYESLDVFSSLYTAKFVQPLTLQRQTVGFTEGQLTPKESYDVVVLDSRAHDRYFTFWDSRARDLPVTDVAGWSVVQISPERRVAPNIPFSGLAPARYIQERQGGLIEIYFRDPGMAERFARACRDAQAQPDDNEVCVLSPAEQGRFARLYAERRLKGDAEVQAR